MSEYIKNHMIEPSIRIASDLQVNVALNPKSITETKPFVDDVRDPEVVILGIAKVFGHYVPEPGNNKVFNSFVAKYNRNLTILADNLQLTEQDETVDIKFSFLEKPELQEVADFVLERMQGVLAVVAANKKSPDLAISDMRISLSKNSEELKELLINNDNDLLSVFDVTRIYLRNRDPKTLIENIERLYKENSTKLSKFEFRELFIRGGIESISESSVSDFIYERGQLAENFDMPLSVASIIKLRYSTDEETEKNNVLQTSTMLSIIKRNLLDKFTKENVNLLINTYFTNFTNSGLFVEDLNKIELKDFNEYANKIILVMCKKVKLDEKGNIQVKKFHPAINLGAKSRSHARNTRRALREEHDLN